MGQKSITLQLPDDLYERVQQAAEASDRPLEKVLVESLDVLFAHAEVSQTTENLLTEMAGYSSAQLWAVVYRRLPWTQSLRWRELTARNKQGLLSDSERRELDNIVRHVEQEMLLRSEALLLLKQRGQDVESYLKMGA